MEKQTLQHPPTTPAVAAKPAVPRATSRIKHFRTDGERKFDGLTYTTVGYVINALLSVVAVYWVERTHSGQKNMNNFIDWTKRQLPWIKDPDLAKTIATRSFFLTGGFAVMLPMKWLEDAKVKLVKKWDRKIYGDAVESDPNIIKAHQELEAAPKQTWLSILGSRVLALIPFYILVGALWENKSALSKLTNPELRGMSKEAIKTAEEANPAAFAQMAGKGIYFDHPVASAARYVGKKIAQLRGKPEIVEQIAHAEREFPGTMTHPKFGAERSHDPNHAAVPYYFISEAITSGVVAWGVYALTRVLGPLIGKKAPTAPAADKANVTKLVNDTAPFVDSFATDAARIMTADHLKAPVTSPKNAAADGEKEAPAVEKTTAHTGDHATHHDLVPKQHAPHTLPTQLHDAASHHPHAAPHDAAAKEHHSADLKSVAPAQHAHDEAPKHPHAESHDAIAKEHAIPHHKAPHDAQTKVHVAGMEHHAPDHAKQIA